MRQRQKPAVKSAKKNAMCTCTHTTHFLGRCRKRVKPPAQQCAECMQDHTAFTQAP